jgi:S-methylmethionine-dependent homocysteine/selenocysteine methylase
VSKLRSPSGGPRRSSLRQIHRDYAAAGAEILTANTFRTQRRTLEQAGLGARAAELTRTALRLAREGAARAGREREVIIAGSDPPLEDCYRPDRVPDDAALAREHTEHVRNLRDAGADLVLIETINTVREGVAALRAASGLPCLVSFACGSGARLLSGESLRDAIRAVAPLNPLAVLVNCLPPSAVAACLPVLRQSDLPFGVYANLGEPAGAGNRRSEDLLPEQFAATAEHWTRAGARLVGGCCGTTPEHIAALAARLADDASSRTR